MNRVSVLTLCFLAVTSTQLFDGVEGARILCASHQFGSHMLMVHTAVEDLIARGHEVYTLISDIWPASVKGLEEKGFKILRFHSLSNSRILADPDANFEDTILASTFEGKSVDHTLASLAASHECEDIDNDDNLDKTLNDLKFDLLVVDTFPLSACLQFLSLKLNIPFITVPATFDIESTRSPLLPSFHPEPLSRFSHNMSFKERIINTLTTVLMFVPALSPFPAIKDTNLLEKYNKDPSTTSWFSLSRKADLHLLSRGIIAEYPDPMMPNIINIEGLTCKPSKPLPDDIQRMTDSSQGIIVLSFGSLITKLPDATAKIFLEAFAQRKELVFWRYKATLPGEVPPNVHIMKWLPQNDLLAHPKTKLFITHSGNNGQYESLYHGIPMLAFPLFAEQHHNARRIEVHGYGLSSNIKELSTDELTDKMQQLINDPSYREKTQKASRIFKKLPMNARETAVFWIEHILEFGADHLKSHALDMPWYSYYMFDVMLLFEAIFILALILVSYLLIFVKGKLFSTKSVTKQKQN